MAKAVPLSLERDNMKKISILILTISMALMLALTPKAHAYTLSNHGITYFNQTTQTVGQADTLDISSTMIEFMYFDLGSNVIGANSPIRVVFSNSITTQALPLLSPLGYNLAKVEIMFYTSTHAIILKNETYFDTSKSLSYFETNFIHPSHNISLDYITIRISNLAPYNELDAVQSMNGAIIVAGSGMIINQTVDTTQYTNGWNDAMNSKVTQIWSLWGNIFDTFMSVFDIFSIQLMGDITIGHIAMVPLVLGLIGFIYALGGKRGR